MSLTLLFKLLHILTAFWFVGGILARTIALRQAARADNPQTVRALVRLTDIFDKRMVILGSMAVLLFGIVTAILGGWPMFGFLEGARTNWLLLSLLLYLTNSPYAELSFRAAFAHVEFTCEISRWKTEISHCVRNDMRNISHQYSVDCFCL